MKNLYKIEDELYIISNTENVSKNCWIITDSRLVQVSYLLSNEVAKGSKVILTTNKLLIKDGVQAIDDEFLQWFVKNPSCDFVDIVNKYRVKSGTIQEHKDGSAGYEYFEYKPIIPKEEPVDFLGRTSFDSLKQEAIEAEMDEYDEQQSVKQYEQQGLEKYSYEFEEQETLEEAAENFVNSTSLRNYKVLFIEGAKSDAAKNYWFEIFKKQSK